MTPRRLLSVLLPLLPLALLHALRAAPPAWGEEGARVLLEGAPAAVVAPAGDAWLRRETSPASGQWVLSLRAREGQGSLEARVFPVRDQGEPRKVLLQAVDLAVRAAGGEGFGLGSVEALDLEGRPAVEAPFTAIFGTASWRGRARLLRASEDRWAYAWGLAPEDAPASRWDDIDRFVRSLAPSGPRFHDPAFGPGDLDAVVVRANPPVTAAHLRAAVGLLEAGLGRRLPVSRAGDLRETLAEAADTPPDGPVVREALGDALTQVRDAEALGEAMRASALALQGRALLGRLLRTRLGAWLAPLQRPDAARHDALACRAEWATFLASLVLDGPPSDVATVLGPLRAEREAAWDRTPEAERAWLLGAGTRWASTRRAWDLADAPRRFRVRLEANLLLAAEDQRAAVAGVADAGALRAWLDARPPPAVADVLRRAFALDEAGERRLLDLLAARDEGFVLGW